MSETAPVFTNGGPVARPPAPGPIPTYVVVGETEGPHGRFVVMQMHTPLGMSMYWIDASQAAAIGDLLTKLGAAVAAGIVLPGGVDG